MAKHTRFAFLRPPDWAVKADLILSPVTALMMFFLAALAAGRGEYLLGFRCLGLGLACAVGAMWSLKMFRARGLHWTRPGRSN